MAQSRKSGVAFSALFALIAFFVLLIMSAFGASTSSFIFVFAVILIVILGRTGAARARLQEQIEQLSSQFADVRQLLYGRITELERQVAELKGAPRTEAPAASPVSASAPAAGATASATAAAPASRLTVAPPLTPKTADTAPPPPPPPPAIAGSTAPPSQPQVIAELARQHGEELFQSVLREPAPSVFERLRPLLNFEELLGTNWLAKIGAALLVLGIAFFLAWQVTQVGPIGKVVVGWLVGGVMLAAGIFFERMERYRIVARAGVAAGWALLFCVAYAMNHIAAARVLESTAADMALMFVVAVAMVVHTLRYRSQVVTGLAFLLAFGSIAINRVNDVYSLTAAVVLAAGVVIVALRMRWFLLEICAMAVAYLNHYLWLRPIIEPMGKHHHSFPEFLPSAVILISYWAIFRFSYLWRGSDDNEQLSAAGALLNGGFLLVLLKYQSVHPEWAFWALLVLGIVELSLGQLRNARKRSLPHIVLTVVGACLLLTAIPFRYGPEYVSLVWLAEAETFFLTGVLARETVFRRVGMFAFVPLIGQLISFEAARVFGARMDGADVKGEFVPAFILAFCALVIYANTHFIARLRAREFEHVIEQVTTRDLSYAAAALVVISGWMAFYFSGTAVVWMAIGCAMAWAGNRFSIPQLRIQAALLGAFSFIRVLAVNLPDAGSAHVFGVLGARWSARLLTTLAVVVLGYLTAVWQRRTEESWTSWLAPGFSWAASTMLNLLVWYELNTASVALGWAIFALLMLEVGLARRSLSLRLQAHVAAVSVFLRILFVNLNATSVSISTFGPRLYTVVPLIALFFYFYARLDGQAELSERERGFKPAQIFAWFGTITAVLLLRFELPLDWVATGWALVVFLLMAIAWKTQKRIFLHQSMLVSVGVLSRGVFHNLYERSYFTSPSHLHSTLTTLSAALVLFASLFFAFKVRRKLPGEGGFLSQVLQIVDARPEQLLFFLPLLLVTAFLAVELRSALVTVAWGLEAVAVFIIALWIGERSYRLSGLGLLFLCVGKIVVIDIWRLGIRDRAITFIILGTLILGVSILYSRNREKVRAFL
jgi:uncharacterized membrane protein